MSTTVLNQYEEHGIGADRGEAIQPWREQTQRAGEMMANIEDDQNT